MVVGGGGRAQEQEAGGPGEAFAALRGEWEGCGRDSIPEQPGKRRLSIHFIPPFLRYSLRSRGEPQLLLRFFQYVPPKLKPSMGLYVSALTPWRLSR